MEITTGNRKIWDRAMSSRDTRFDGRFFVAVRSTGIYCRPICPAVTPLLKNIQYFVSAAAASEAGFRPCLRCRPETAPGTPAWSGTGATVSRALKMIGGGFLDGATVSELSDKLGIGSRHLCRLFNQHLGTTPGAVAKTRRLHFAKRLVDETRLPMTDIAPSAGFGSLRRFNAAFRQAYGCAPSKYRKGRRGRQPNDRRDHFVLHLPYRPPLHWEGLMGFLRARAIPGVERVDQGIYSRSIRLDDKFGLIRVQPMTAKDHLELNVQFPDPRKLSLIVNRVRRIFDLDASPLDIHEHLEHDPWLAPVVAPSRGLRVPGSWDGFETSVRAILGQQISVRAATTVAGRLVKAFGSRSESGEETGGWRYFPTPESLARADLSTIGLTPARGRAIGELAKAVCQGFIKFDGSLSPEQLVSALTELPGIGDWTAQYVAMRALGDPDAFPASDLGLLKAFAMLGGADLGCSLAERAEDWRPWRAYAAMHLWNFLAQKTDAPQKRSKGAGQ